MNLADVRSHFPQIGSALYLNAASEGPMPAQAIDEAVRVAGLKARPWEIGDEFWYEQPIRVRGLIERLIGAPTGSVALVPGTSAGIGLAARGLRLGPGDEVLLLEAQFPSNVNPWRAAAMRGATVRTVARPFGTDPTDALCAAIGPATRVVAIDWVHFVDGAVCDLARIGAACRERGVRLVVDAAQGVGALKLDAGALAIDVVAGPSHKWLLGPVGTGYVCVSPDLLDELQPWNAGWVNLAQRSGFRNLLGFDGEPPGDATRFETGSPPYSLLASWRVSLEMQAGIGAEAIERRVLALASMVLAGIRALAPAEGGSIGLEPVTAPDGADPRSGIVAFRAARGRTMALYRGLVSRGVIVAIREGAIRVSPHVYNTDDEIEAFLQACRALLDA